MFIFVLITQEDERKKETKRTHFFEQEQEQKQAPVRLEIHPKEVMATLKWCKEPPNTPKRGDGNPKVV